jgi:hypothetical protein
MQLRKKQLLESSRRSSMNSGGAKSSHAETGS